MTNFRGIAILLILLVHSVTRFKGMPYFEYIYPIFAHSTVVFLFISGFLFEHVTNKKQMSYGTFLSKKIKRLIYPYFFWLIPGLIVTILLGRAGGLDWLCYTILIGVGHLNDVHWYIPFIFLVFSLFPFWKWLEKKETRFNTFLIISLLFSVITSRGQVNWFYPLTNFCAYIGIFVLGMFFSRH